MIKSHYLTQDEINSLLFYQGSLDSILLNPQSDLKKFYEISGAYNIMNSLLFPRFSNEKSRYEVEKKKVDIALFDHVDELISVYERMYSAMCKYTKNRNGGKKLHTYRGDRRNTLKCFSETGVFPSFISSTTEKEVVKKFLKKDGAIMLDIEAPDSIVHIDMNEVLGETSHHDEREILFSPFLKVEYEKVEGGDIPEYLVRLSEDDSSGQYDVSKKEILKPDNIKIVKDVYSALFEGREVDAEVLDRYVEWKEMLQQYLKNRFKEIRKTICGTGI